MILKDGSEIRHTDQYRHKYDSAIAEYIDASVGGHTVADDCTGDVESSIGFVWRFGKRIMTENSQGFVSCVRQPSVELAESLFDAIDSEYVGLDDPDGGDDAIRFFMAHACSSFDPETENEEEGRLRAQALAAAEKWAAENHVTFNWEDDWEITSHVDEFCYEPSTCEMCAAVSMDTGAVLASLSCIDDATPEYRRVVEAELALEALSA